MAGGMPPQRGETGERTHDRMGCTSWFKPSRKSLAACVQSGLCNATPANGPVMTANQVDIREVIAHGLVFDPKNSEALRTMDLHDLLLSVPRLFELLEQRDVDYTLVGGIAMLVYVQGRNTQDIDLILSADGLSRLPEIKVLDRKGHFARGTLGGLQVDLLLTDNLLFEKVRRQHTVRQRFAEREIPCASVEGLLLLKLFALPSLYRQAQFDRVELYERDLGMLLRQYRPDLEPLFEELAKHLSESDLGEVRSIVQEIQERIERAKRRFHDE